MRDFFRKRSVRRALRVVGTLLAVGLFIFLLSQQGWDEIVSSIRKLDAGRVALVATLAFISRAAVAGRWTSLLWLSGIRLPLGRILRITYAGLFASNFLPTAIGGDIVRLAGVAFVDRQRGRYASSIAVDRLVGLTGMAMLLPLGIARALAAPALPGLAPLIGLAAVGDPQAPSAARRRGLIDRIRRAFDSTLALVREWLSNPRALLVALAFTWVHMLLKFTSMTLLFRAFGESIGFWTIAGLWSFVYFVSLFPVSINSLGLLEVSAGLVYSSLGGAAVSSALTVALLMRTFEALASVPGVIALPGMMSLEPNPEAAPAEDPPDQGN